MALENSQVALVQNVPAKIATTGFGDPVLLVNNGTGVIYIGKDNTVSTANGFRVDVAPNATSRLELTDFEGEVWAMTADVAGANVCVLQGKAG